METDQNLTFEEWQQSQYQSEQIKIINKSGGNFGSEKEGYVPRPRPCDSGSSEWFWMASAFMDGNRRLEEKIEQLESSLNRVKSELKEAIEKRDQYKRWWGSSDSDYLKQRGKTEELENRVKGLKRELCEERGCGCGGYCL